MKVRFLLTILLCQLIALSSVHGREFFCAGGDAACLIAAINEANTNGQENTILLESGEYVTEPISITGPFPLTIMGQGAESTIIRRHPGTPPGSEGRRVISVAAEGNLALSGLTITGGLPLIARSRRDV